MGAKLAWKEPMRTEITEKPQGDPPKPVPTKPPVEPDNPAEPV